MTNPLRIGGDSAPGFARLRATFETNFRERGEVGASVCVFRGGEKLVDLWGGIARPATGEQWRADTLVCMMSVGKSMTALCALILIDRGVIELEAPVVRYWPEFAGGGKGAVSVRMLLGGLSGVLYADAASDNAGLDWDAMVAAFEVQRPAWPLASDHAYHSMSFGQLVGELVRRADGRPIERFFAEEVAAPLGAEYAFGLDDAQVARCADIIPNPASDTLGMMSDPTSPLGRAWRVLPDLQTRANAEDFRKQVFPSANGHGNARSVATIYSALAVAGAPGRLSLVSRATVDRARTEVWDGICAMTGRHYRYGLGVFLQGCALVPLGPNPGSFGHPGVGGALGFADPKAGIAFAYSPNAMCEGAGVGARCEALVDALYRDLGDA